MMAAIGNWMDWLMTSEPMNISVVIPVLNEEAALPLLYEELRAALDSLGRLWEIIFVDDGSTDGSFAVIERLHQADGRVRAIQFRRNFGKAAALAAGFAAVRGTIVVTMDADLQDDPAELPALLSKLDEGFDLVSGWKHPRRDPWTKTWPSRLWNWTTALLGGLRLHDFNCGFKVYRRKVIQELDLYGELYRYIPVLAHWRGFRVTETPVHHRPRRFGQSKFGASRFMRGLFDLLTVVFLTQYTTRPLHLFGWAGLATFGVGFAINLYLTVLWFQGQGIGHRPLLTLGVLLITTGVQFFSFGLLAEMLTKSATAGRPPYAVRRTLGASMNAAAPTPERPA